VKLQRSPRRGIHDIARRMQAAIGCGQDGERTRTAGRIRHDLVAVIEHDGEHRRLVIGCPERPPSDDEVGLVCTLDAVANCRPDAWHIVEFRWIQLASSTSTEATHAA
jgi:hypothetical protein